MCKYIVKKSKQDKNTYILVFSPNISSLNSKLNSFLDKNEIKGESTIKLDVIAFVGDTNERFIQLRLKDGMLVNNSILKGIKDKETEEVTLEEYSKLKIGEINRIYPIAYRNKILSKREETIKESSF